MDEYIIPTLLGETLARASYTNVVCLTKIRVAHKPFQAIRLITPRTEYSIGNLYLYIHMYRPEKAPPQGFEGLNNSRKSYIHEFFKMSTIRKATTLMSSSGITLNT